MTERQHFTIRLWNKAGMQSLKELTFEQSLLAMKRDLPVEEIKHLSSQALYVEMELAKFSEHNCEQRMCGASL